MTLAQRAGVGLAIAMVALFSSDAALAQVALPGWHVRIEPVSGAARKEGTLVAMTNDSVSYRPGLSDALLTVPMDSVRTVYASSGFESHEVRDGFIGSAIGIASVVVSTAALCKIHPAGDGPPCALGAVYYSVPAALLGFAGGFLIGREHRTENWERVYERPETASLIIGPAPHNRFALGLSLPFGGNDSR